MFVPLYAIVLDFQQEAAAQRVSYSGPGATGVLVSAILRGLMAVAAISVAIFLIWGAFDWINGGGEKGKIDAARQKMTGAVLGLFVLASTMAIYMLVQDFLGLNVLQYGTNTPAPQAIQRPLEDNDNGSNRLGNMLIGP